MKQELTPEETARVLGISTATAYRLIKAGTLQAYKTPNGLRCSVLWLVEKFGPAMRDLCSTGYVHPKK